jgi:hypothetical protein
MYYEIVSRSKKNEIKREKILENREEIIRIVQKMLEKDAYLTYEYYDLYKDTFFTFAKDVIDKTTILRTPNIVFDNNELIGIDKNILIKPKIKTIIEIMKKI